MLTSLAAVLEARSSFSLSFSFRALEAWGEGRKEGRGGGRGEGEEGGGGQQAELN